MGRTADLDKELNRIEQDEAWNASDEVIQIEVKKPLDKVIPIRLAAADWSKLRAEANELGIGPTTLARMWVLERLRSRYDLARGSLRIVQPVVRDAPAKILTKPLPQILDEIEDGTGLTDEVTKASRKKR